MKTTTNQNRLFCVTSRCVSLLTFTLVFGGSVAQAWTSKDFQKPTTEELKKKLTPEQFKVTQQDGTERPFKNEFHDKKDEGIYVDIVSGEPLFSSIDKYDSGTGWPSFSQPLKTEFIKTKVEKNLFMGNRTEVRSKIANSHLGHVFEDGPKPTGLRYCMNSASMRFIAKADLVAQGYAEFEALFKK